MVNHSEHVSRRTLSWTLCRPRPFSATAASWLARTGAASHLVAAPPAPPASTGLAAVSSCSERCLHPTPRRLLVAGHCGHRHPHGMSKRMLRCGFWRGKHQLRTLPRAAAHRRCFRFSPSASPSAPPPGIQSGPVAVFGFFTLEDALLPASLLRRAGGRLLMSGCSTPPEEDEEDRPFFAAACLASSCDFCFRKCAALAPGPPKSNTHKTTR